MTDSNKSAVRKIAKGRGLDAFADITFDFLPSDTGREFTFAHQGAKRGDALILLPKDEVSARMDKDSIYHCEAYDGGFRVTFHTLNLFKQNLAYKFKAVILGD